MGVVEIASAKSVWRAIDYCKKKKVLSWINTENGYSGIVSGSEDNTYDVDVNTIHPKSSTCTCPFATDHKVICKHMLAVYFTANPKEMKRIIKEAEDYEKDEERRVAEHNKDLYKYVKMFSKEELQDQMVELLLELEYYRRR